MAGQAPGQVSLLQPMTTLVVQAFDVPVALVDAGACGGVDDLFFCASKISVRGLNQDGFVIEVGLLQQLVRDAYASRRHEGTLRASCEQLAGGVIDIIHREFKERLESVTVRVNNPTGYVEVIWNKGEAVPPFPRLATTQEHEAMQARLREMRQRPGCGERRERTAHFPNPNTFDID